MEKKLVKILVLVSLVLIAASCTTVSYSANRNYVGFSADGVKSVQQTKKSSFTEDTLYSTFDDEFVYNEDGVMIKHIQTQYFENGDKYDEYTVEYQIIGEEALPKSVAVNGVVYMEVEYDILASDHEGPVDETTSSPVFSQMKPDVDLMRFKFYEFSNWTIDVDVFDVPFRSDNRFVSTEEKYAFYTGLSTDKVLTPGYDNIVITRFYHSPSKYIAGYNMSIDNDVDAMNEITEKDFRNTEFLYEWSVIGGEIVQTGMTLKENYKKDYMIFNIERDFDASGRRTSEIWNVRDSFKNKEIPVTLFTQTLTY